MFDPFGDAEARGYLQNFEGLSDLEMVKVGYNWLPFYILEREKSQELSILTLARLRATN